MHRLQYYRAKRVEPKGCNLYSRGRVSPVRHHQSLWRCIGTPTGGCATPPAAASAIYDGSTHGSSSSTPLGFCSSPRWAPTVVAVHAARLFIITFFVFVYLGSCGTKTNKYEQSTLFLPFQRHFLEVIDQDRI